MKLSTTILGIVSGMLITFGSLFKLQHYPGGGLMLVLGVFIFAFPFLILLLIHRIKNRSTGLEAAEGVVQTITFWFLSMGALFKVQHYPGGGILMIIGLQLLAFVYLPLLLVRFYREKEFRKSISLMTLAIGLGGFSMAFAYQTSESILDTVLRNERLVGRNTRVQWKTLGLDLEQADSIQGPAVKTILQKARKVHDSIEAYKEHLIREVDGLPKDAPSSKLQLPKVMGKGNFDIPTMILVGADPAKRKKGEWSAYRLKQMLKEYRDTLLEEAKSEKVRKLLQEHWNLKDPDHHPLIKHWETLHFYHTPLVGVIQTLSTFQSTVWASAHLVVKDRSLDR